jgi:hypothetical protein
MSNTITELEAKVEEARQYLNEMICQYEEALENPDYYDVELSKEAMDEAQAWYEEAKSDLEAEMMWAKL